MIAGPMTSGTVYRCAACGGQIAHGYPPTYRGEPERWAHVDNATGADCANLRGDEPWGPLAPVAVPPPVATGRGGV